MDWGTIVVCALVDAYGQSTEVERANAELQMVLDQVRARSHLPPSQTIARVLNQGLALCFLTWKRRPPPLKHLPFAAINGVRSPGLSSVASVSLRNKTFFLLPHLPLCPSYRWCRMSQMKAQSDELESLQQVSPVPTDCEK